jgi:hypothetical protein
LTPPRLTITADAPIRERLNWEPDPAQYQAIRRVWINHSKAEDARDLPGVIEITRMTGTHRGTWDGRISYDSRAFD